MEKVKLKDICSMQSGGTPSRSKSEFYTGNIPWAKISDLEKSNDGYIYETEEHITEEALKSINNRFFKVGTLLLAMYGSVGKTAIAKIDLSTNQAILGLNIIDKNNVDIKYLRYWFTTIKEQLLNRAVGAALANISLGIVKELEIPLPNLATQQRIAAILDQADAIIQNNRAIVKKYDALTQSLFLDMFGDPVKNEKGWEKVSLKYFINKLNTGVSVNSEENSKGDYFILKTSCVYSGIFNPKQVKTIREDEIQRAKLNPKKDSIIISRMNTSELVGKSAYIFENFPNIFLPDRLWQTEKTNVEHSVLWLSYNIGHTSFMNEISKISSGTSGSMKNISKASFLDLKSINPPLKLQNQFAERVAMIEAQKQQAQLELAKSEELFQSLLQRAFNGELS